MLGQLLEEVAIIQQLRTARARQSRTLNLVVLAIGALALVVVIVVTEGMRQYFERKAVREALLGIEVEAAAASEGYRRQLDALERIVEHVHRLTADTQGARAEFLYVDDPFRRIIEDRRFAFAALAVRDADPAAGWRIRLGGDHLDGDLLALAERALVPSGATVFGAPVRTAMTRRWVVPVFVGTAWSAGGDGPAVAVVLLDCERLSGILGQLMRHPSHIVSLWRADGLLLSTSVADFARPLSERATLPSLGSRAAKSALLPATQYVDYERFFAIREISDAGMIISVSSARDFELDDVDNLTRAIRVVELVSVVLVIGATLLVVMILRHARIKDEMEIVRASGAVAAEIAAQRERMLEGVDAGIVLQTMAYDGTQSGRFVNSGLARLLHISPETIEAAGTIMRFAEPPTAPDLLPRMLADLRHQGTFNLDIQLRCGDGRLRWMSVHTRVVSRDDERMQCVTMILDKSVERAAAEAAVLSARLATLGELSAGIVHEVRQPLTVIATVAHTTQVGLMSVPPMTPDEIVASLGEIVRMVKRASDITDHLRHLAREPEEGVQIVPLAKVITGAVMIVRFALRDARVRLVVDVDKTIPSVVGHPVLLEQVLINLILNGRDAIAESGAERGEITISARAEGAMVALRVRDSGRGIPDEVMENLFKPFFTTKPPGRGTGLGLSLSATILRACGGSMSAANTGDGGAEFTLLLLPASEVLTESME